MISRDQRGAHRVGEEVGAEVKGEESGGNDARYEIRFIIHFPPQCPTFWTSDIKLPFAQLLVCHHQHRGEQRTMNGFCSFRVAARPEILSFFWVFGPRPFLNISIFKKLRRADHLASWWQLVHNLGAHQPQKALRFVFLVLYR